MKKAFKVDCWLKNNKEWYYPLKEVDLSLYDHVEFLSSGHDGDLVYAYNNGQKEDGRLFKGRYYEERHCSC
jgi:hypothetical protein